MLKISSMKLTSNWIIQNLTKKYHLRRIKQTERKSIKNWQTVSAINLYLYSSKTYDSVSSIENLLIKWFRKICSKNYLVTVKKMLLTMMAMSNVDANVRSTNNGNMNTKQIKDTKFYYRHFLITESTLYQFPLST